MLVYISLLVYSYTFAFILMICGCYEQMSSLKAFPSLPFPLLSSPLFLVFLPFLPVCLFCTRDS